jgi:hypothetical protein
MFDIPLTEDQLQWIENNIATRAAKDLAALIRSLRDGTESDIDEYLARQCLDVENHHVLVRVRDVLYKTIAHYRGA